MRFDDTVRRGPTWSGPIAICLGLVMTIGFCAWARADGQLSGATPKDGVAEDRPSNPTAGDSECGEGVAPEELTKLTLNGNPCFDMGEVVEITVDVTGLTEVAAGGQFFLKYDTETFLFLSIAPGVSPFEITFFVEVDPDLGHIDYAVGSFDPPDTIDDALMATINFGVIGTGGVPFVRFRDHFPPTKLTGPNGETIIIETVDLGTADDVDLTDVAKFQRCFCGEGTVATPVCQDLFDTDGDGDVDLTDYDTFAESMTGITDWTCEG